MHKSSSTWPMLLGVLAIVIGILALVWPGVTILALDHRALGAAGPRA